MPFGCFSPDLSLSKTESSCHTTPARAPVGKHVLQLYTRMKQHAPNTRIPLKRHTTEYGSNL